MTDSKAPKPHTTALKQPFSPAEDTAILAAAEKGETLETTARRLGRKPGCVWRRRIILARGEAPAPAPRPYTQSENETILAQRDSGMTYTKIGRMLGRSKSSIRSHYNLLLSRQEQKPN